MTFSATQADFRVGIAQADDWHMAAADILRQIGTPTALHRLGIIYVSSAYAHNMSDIEVFFRQTTGVPHWVGCVGHGVLTHREEIFEAPAMTAMLCPIPEDGFHVLKEIHEDTEPGLSHASSWLSQVDVPLALIHADPSNNVIPGLLQDITLESSAYLVGGLTSTMGEGSQLADGLEGKGISGVMFSNRIAPMITGLTQGCSPIGPIHRVTESEDNILISLDNRPALEVFKEEIGDILSRDLEKVAGYIFSALPVEGSDKGDYMVRNILAIDPGQQMIAIGAELEPGDEVLFCKRDTETAEEDLRRLLKDLRVRAGTSPIKGGVYINCAGRGPNQFGGNSREMEIIREELGDNVPITGFFANGEVSYDRLYSYTGVLTLFL
ncbi:FIST signal transduction protein [Curvivirga sp.]|uniref:FIST signal transduction protein n=1 Tax=Curvivirga sp. TaxID=2856848 RepID=UPI003B5C16E4